MPLQVPPLLRQLLRPQQYSRRHRSRRSFNSSALLLHKRLLPRVLLLLLLIYQQQQQAGTNMAASASPRQQPVAELLSAVRTSTAADESTRTSQASQPVVMDVVDQGATLPSARENDPSEKFVCASWIWRSIGPLLVSKRAITRIVGWLFAPPALHGSFFFPRFFQPHVRSRHFFRCCCVCSFSFYFRHSFW